MLPVKLPGMPGFHALSCVFKILLFTDGLIQEINDAGQSFESTFMEKVLPSLSMMPITDVVTVSFRRLVDFKGSNSFMDDICILGMEVL